MDSKLVELLNTVRINSGLSPLESYSKELDLRDDLELDSISIAELVASVDISFNANVNEDGMVQTIGDIQDKIKSE